ncbi:MAG: P1 family peptidase [Pseudomonadota bacterium]
MNAPGASNSICDVPGIRVGHAENHDLVTGASVILPEAPCVAAVDHRGGGIGARDTVLLGAGSAVPFVHGICLSGGSAYGLDAAGGVLHGMRQDGIGFAVKSEIVPIVPQAILFDLTAGGLKRWEHPPWWDLGLAAYRAATFETSSGNVGAGLGATAGRLKGGFGTASSVEEGLTVGAVAAANSVGDVVFSGTRTFRGWMLERNGELGGQLPPPSKSVESPVADATAGANTTLAVVATDAALTRDQAYRVAIMAQDGLALTTWPVHSPMDGDTVFVLSTGKHIVGDEAATLTRIGTMAAECVARAIMRGVYEAEPLAGYPAYRELF